MPSQNVGRRGLLKKSAGLGLAASAASLAVAMPAVAQTPAADDETVIQRAKDDVRTEYDKAKADFEALGADISDDTRAAYDDIKKGLDDLGADLDKAEAIPHDAKHDVKRAYRDIQHKLEDLDHRMEVVSDSLQRDGKDAWHRGRETVHTVHKKVDHVIDAIF